MRSICSNDGSVAYALDVPTPAQVAAVELMQVVRHRTRQDRPSPADVRTALLKELGRATRAHDGEPATLASWSDGIDVPGEVYEALIAGAARREQGQFQTPFAAADVMAAWLLAEPIVTLFDPGVGTGRLLFRAGIRAGEKPQRYVGLDIDEVCLAMARLNLFVRGVTPVALRQADFLLDDDALLELGFDSAPPDAVIANPPFSRHQSLDAERKEQLHRRVEERLGLHLSRRAGLHALFLLRALEISAPDARLAFITPAGWLDVAYGQPVKRYLSEHVDVEAMVLFGSSRFLFDGVRTTAAITLMRKGIRQRPETLIVHATDPELEVEEVVSALTGRSTSVKTTTARLRDTRPWSSPAVRLGAGTPLAELARVRRGIATGANRFFVVSEATRRQWELPMELLRACLYRPRVFPGDLIDDAVLSALSDDVPRWVLASPHADHDQREDAFGCYLRFGMEQLAADESFLARNRKVWHQPEQRGACAIIVPYFNRGLPRFIRNLSGAVPLNTFHVIEPLPHVGPDQLWRALNQPEILRQVKRLGRDYGNRMWKVEPGDLKKVRVRTTALSDDPLRTG
jgi:adenine-specific DNA-methyltransferase